MRIIAGRNKGRRLEGPPGLGVRPTSDRLRETLFNVIRHRVEGARVLDGFAGTGAIGLEALSRGATHVTFVERDPRVLAVLDRNIATCGAREACATIQSDFIGISASARHVGPFDLLLIDPPYDTGDLDGVLAEAMALMAVGALIVIEHSRRRVLPAAVLGLTRRRTLVAGDSALAFYAAGDPR